MAEDKPISLTIGTAGHVDHGKTTLVRYMTGTDTDRLEEEHRRGISIVPGYAVLDLPGGHRASLIDVPGHERFVKNMVAGSTGVDAFLLVVAADDGVMPQTREHLDILRVLGVERGIVALSKIDAVDEETAEIAQLDVEELLEETGISAPIIPVSGTTGDGVDALLQALDGLAAEGVATRREGELVRMPVDRAFVLKGIGVVVTGTLWTGEIRPGDQLLTSTGYRPRVRGVQNHGLPAESAQAGARTALDLSGIDASEIQAGDVLLSRLVTETRLFDARVRLLESAKPLRHGVLVRLHHGTRSTNARIRTLDSGDVRPGESVLARLRLEDPLVLLSGDHFVLRALAPPVTVGGGTVLDPSPTGRRPESDWLEALESGDLSETLPMLLNRTDNDGMNVEELSLALSSLQEEISHAAEINPQIKSIGTLYAPAANIASASDRLLKELKRRAREQPENPALSVAEARTATRLSTRLADALLEELAGQKIRVSDTGVSLPGADEIPPELEAEAQRTLETLRNSGAAPPATTPTPALRLLLKRGEVVNLGGSMFAAREVAEEVLESIKTACREDGDISLSGLRDSLNTSRKFAQAWLEYSDSQGVTSRTGDVRVLTRRYRKDLN